MSKHFVKKGENYLFCVGFGLLGGILLRLAATTGSWVDLDPSLSEGECERACEDGDIFETKEEEGLVLAWDILTPSESINVMAKITAMIKLQKDFMVFVNLDWRMSFSCSMFLVMMNYGHICNVYYECDVN